jgi:hypothetical protein
VFLGSTKKIPATINNKPAMRGKDSGHIARSNADTRH